MIIECKQCGSKFKLDEGLLREEGSKVRCSVCKSVFRSLPAGCGTGGRGRTKDCGPEPWIDGHPGYVSNLGGTKT